MWIETEVNRSESSWTRNAAKLPMLLALIPYIAGVCAGIACGDGLRISAGLAAGVSLAAIILVRRYPALAGCMVLSALFFFGHSRFVFACRIISTDHLICALPRDDVALIGRIDSMPDDRDGFTSFLLDVEGIETGSGAFKVATGLVRVGVAESLDLAGPRFRHGAIVRVEVSLDEPRGYENPGVFSYRTYLEHRRIFISGDAGYWDFITVVSDPPWYDLDAHLSWLRGILLRWIESTAKPYFEGDLIEAGIRTDHLAGFSQALILGHRANIDDRTQDDFKNTGMYHVLAISGLHIAIMATLIRMLSVLFLRNRKSSAIITIVALSLYSVLAGLSSSVVRASAMVILASTAVLLDRPVRAWNIVASTAFGILVWNPMLILDAGFQLTFLATAGILLFSRRFLLMLRFIPTRFVREAVSMSIAAQFSTALISAIHFNRIGLLAFIPYILTIPLITGAIWSGAVGLALVWYPFFGVPCLRIHALLIALFSFIVQISAKLPLMTMTVLTPGWPEYIMFGSLVCACLLHKRHTAYAVAACFLAAGMFGYRCIPSSDPLEVHFLDVGNGDSIIIRMPDGEGILIDTGGVMNSKADIGRMIVGRMLRNLRIGKLAVLVATHEHPDHIGGMQSVIEDHRIDRLWVSSRDSAGIEMQRLLTLAESRGIRIEELETGTLWNKLPLNGNDRSVVLALEFGAVRILFAGDAESASESGLLDYGWQLQSTILKLGHHGSRTSSTSSFLKAVDPVCVMIPCGFKNRFGHPHSEVIDRLEHETRVQKIFRSDRNGMISVRTDGREIHVGTYQACDF